MSKKPQTRALAALAISKLLTRKQTLTVILPDYTIRLQEKKDRAFLQELCYGVVRHYFLLEFILDNLLEKPLKPKDSDIKVLIMSGLYQGIFLGTPAHALVSASVEACDELRKSWAKKLVNAILRKYLRESQQLHTKSKQNPVARYSHPEWLLEFFKQDYPDTWQQICEENNQYPPMFLRVNTREISRDEYLGKLVQKNINAMAAPYSVTGIKLEKPVDIHELPGFDQGMVSVQDLAAQLTPQILDIKPGQRVLDACAAPGGKLAHILEYEPQLEKVVAVENDANRYERLIQTLERLNLEADIKLADTRKTDTWWDGEKFDRILLDAPCSATGVIRRHPDIKLLRTPDEINPVAKLQNELLHTLWPLLITGGKLLYVTCSTLKKENDLQITNFLEHQNNVKVIEINAVWGIKTEFGRQILPGQDNMDGFYYACLQKI